MSILSTTLSKLMLEGISTMIYPSLLNTKETKKMSIQNIYCKTDMSFVVEIGINLLASLIIAVN